MPFLERRDPRPVKLYLNQVDAAPARSQEAVTVTRLLGPPSRVEFEACSDSRD